MPLPTQVLLTFASGLASALVARAELRVSPKHVLMSQPFLAFLVYLSLVVAPIAVYFYAFHGDWYLLYWVDTERVPSAIALVGCLLLVAIGAAGFGLAASLVRSQRDQWVGGAIGLTTALAAAVIPLARTRLSVVGTYAQFHGDFGLSAFGGALLQGTLWMTLWTLLGLVYLLYRLGPGSRRA